MSTAIIVALVSGVLSLAAAAVSFWSAQRVARLNSELEEQRHARSQGELAAKLRARHRDPLLSAAFDLQSRLYNMQALRRGCASGAPGRRSEGGLRVFAYSLAT